MKTKKAFGLVAMAAFACSAAIGAGSASATVLCKTNTKPCTQDYAAGTKVSMQLPSGFDMKWTTGEGALIATCSFSTLAGETSNTGGSGSKVSVALSKVTWTTCGSQTVEALKPGTLEIKYSSESIEHKVTLKGTEWKVSGCTYSAGAETEVGVIRSSFEGSAAQMVIQGYFTKVSGALCSGTVIWEGNYEITAPKPLYVAES